MASGKISMYLEEEKETAEMKQKWFCKSESNHIHWLYFSELYFQWFPKYYTVKLTFRGTNSHPSSPPSAIFFFLNWEPWKITAGLTTDSLPVTSNKNFKVRLQKCSLFLHRDLQMLHFPFTIFFLGSAVIYYSIINSLISPDLINLNFN